MVQGRQGYTFQYEYRLVNMETMLCIVINCFLMNFLLVAREKLATILCQEKQFDQMIKIHITTEGQIDIV